MTNQNQQAEAADNDELPVSFVAVLDEDGNITVEQKQPETPAQAATPTTPEAAPQATNVPVETGLDEDEDPSGLSPEEIKLLKRRTQERIQTLSRRSKASDAMAAAERERRLALEQEVERLKTRSTAYETQSIEASEASVAAEISMAATEYRQAREAQDADAEMAAVSRMAQAQARKMALDAYKAQRASQPKPAAETKPAAPQAPQQPATPVVDNPRAHAATADWLKKNETWFGKDPVLTQATRAIHDQLLLQEGFRPDSDDPDIGYEAYFREIDNRLKEYFPGRFAQPDPKLKGKQVVSTPSRSPSATPEQAQKRTIQVNLTPRQIAWAKENGVPLEQMIKEQARLEAKRR